MGKALFRATLMAATGFGFGHVAPAWAQSEGQQADQKAESTNDIVVTARRTEERLQDVPIAVAVYSQEQLSARNVVNPADLAIYTPSLAVNSKFGSEKSSFTIRGFGQDIQTEPSVGVYFADVVAPKARGAVFSGNGAGVGSLFDLQNVQVLKGPQGTLFGRNTTGGAILLVPQKPTSKLEGYVEGSLGSYNMHRLQGVLNVPLSDTLKVRAGVDWQQRDGYLHNKSGIGPDRLGNVNYIAARLSVLANLTPDIENYTVASYSYSNTHNYGIRVTICNPASGFASFACGQVARQTARGDGFWDVENSLPDPYLRIRQWQAINTTTWKVSDDVTLKNIVSYSEYRERAAVDNNGTFWPDASGNNLFRVITFNPGLGSPNSSSQSQITEELRLEGKAADGRLTWQVGGYLEATKPLGFSSNATEVLVLCSNIQALQCQGFGQLSLSNFKKTWNNKGFYGQATYALTDKLNVTGGLRYTIDRITEVAQQVSATFATPNVPVLTCQNVLKFNSDPVTFAPLVVTNTAQCTDTQRARSQRPTWLVSLDYKPSDDLMVYAKYARGYRAGGLNSSNFGLEAWGPEKVDSYEVGSKLSFGGPLRGNLNVAAFYNDFRDQQVPASGFPNPAYVNRVGGAQAEINAGKSRIWGIEVDGSVKLFKGLQFDLGYAYLNTKLIALTQPPASVIYTYVPQGDVGGPLVLSPSHRLTLSANYTLPLAEGLGEVTVGGTYTYTSSYNYTSPRSSPLYKIKATNLVNLNATWKSVLGSPVDISAFMTNATNQKYFISPIQTFAFFGIEGGVTNEPRMWGFRLKYHFGN